MPEVLNRRAPDASARKGVVYIGRPSKWGNPFVIGRDGDRHEVIAKYREWVESRPELIGMIKAELKGQDLICFCAPLACHGDVLLSIANET